MNGDWVSNSSSVVTSGLSVDDSSSSYLVDTVGGNCYGWWPYWGGCTHYHWNGLEPHEHDYAQAAAPFEATLFCRKCGETKQLKMPKAKRSEQ